MDLKVDLRVIICNNERPYTNNTRSDVTAVHAAGGAEAEQDGCWLGTEELRQKQEES